MKRPLIALAAGAFAVLLVLPAPAFAAKKSKAAPAKTAPAKSDSKLKSSTFSGLKFRSIGPAVSSGRIIDLVVNPKDKSTWYVAAAYGGVWKTTNAGTTFSPVFDAQGTSSIGCVTLDPQDPLTVWVGTGENNSQRSVGWGDGVYRSQDGGKTWENMGLKASEHIGTVLVDPRNSNTVFAAAQGPLWAPGGDRGVYKSTDGGKTWKQALKVDEWTGANEVRFDPRNPDVLFATTYQRHRKVWSLINGGPGCAIWKSIDGGETWKKLVNGLPKGEMGRIGIVLPPREPGSIIATIEASDEEEGTYRSDDGGMNWTKLNSQPSGSAQYYSELFADPNVPGRVYLVDTYLQTSDDGGKTWRRAGEKSKHVDNHIVWIDPDDSRHMLVGCDGGLYETFDRCANWVFFPNLPVTQFYKVEVDNALPFYNVYGGTQDNLTWGGPSRTTTVHGILNSDWFSVVGGDGFQPRVDPTDPNIVYGESQHAGIVRFDRHTGNTVDIQPQPEPGEPGLRWNWDTPVIISPHSHTRIYMAAQRVFRSDGRGDSWTAVSGDLTRQIDRNKLPMMGRVWSVDAIAKNASTSFYGNIVALDESPKKEGLLAAGTDDGLIQVSEDGGKTWRRIDSVPGVGEYAYVSRVVWSRHDANTLYATFDRHKMGDFKAYVYKSTDLGRSWTNITGDLPGTGSTYAFVEDTKEPGLLFVGTEFGVFFTPNGGAKWVQLKGGLPVACIRDLAIQRRDDDLVVCTFSRGFYILDDLAPLRLMASEAKLAEEAVLLPVRRTLQYVESSPLGGRGHAMQGERFFLGQNPPYGAVFTYYLAKDFPTLKKRRHESEAEIAKKGGNVFYPSWDSLRAEAREEAPAMVLTVSDAQGNVVRRLTGPVDAGFQRVAWDLRYPDPEPAALQKRQRGEFESNGGGPLARPGTYTVALARRAGGVLTPLGQPQTFTVEALAGATLPEGDRAATVEFQRQVSELSRSLQGAQRLLGEAQTRATLLAKALNDAPNATEAQAQAARALQKRLADLNEAFYGDAVKRGHNESVPPALVERVNQITDGAWEYTGPPTKTHRRNYEIADADFRKALATLQAIVTDLEALEAQAEAAGAPWTPGRMPVRK
jgi:photosystem II stability/assembly factor-like uncharacterized protein